MKIQTFWNVIGAYNSETITAQILLSACIVIALVLSYLGKVKWISKLVLGIANIYIGIVFFGIYGTEPIQKYFALPLYLCCGALFIFESIRYRDDTLIKPNKWQAFLLLLYMAYPVVSFALGNAFPKLVTYIMPCPLISLSIAVYSGYKRKNILLLALLTIWGLTGIKSILFHAYEDMILLVCGIYGVYLIFAECRKRKSAKANPNLSS